MSKIKRETIKHIFTDIVQPKKGGSRGVPIDFYMTCATLHKNSEAPCDVALILLVMILGKV
jgi:hypothetical protein